MKRLLCLFILVLLTVVTFSAGVLAENEKYETYGLDNGLMVVLRESPFQDIVTIGLAVKAGQDSEVDPKDYGLNYWTSHMIYYGTSRRPSFAALAQPVEQTGGVFAISPMSSVTVVYAKVASTNFREAMDTVSDASQNPAFRPDFMQYVVPIYAKSLENQSYTDKGLAYRKMIEGLFGRHPYGHSEQGTGQAMRVRTWSDFRKYHDTYYIPNNCALFISGKFDSEEAKKYVNEFFSKWKSGPKPPTVVAAAPPASGTETNSKVSGKQAHVYMGFRVPSVASKDGPALAVLGAIWGNGMGSRIFQELRSKQGLAYECYSEYDWFQFKDPSVFYGYLQTAPDKIDAVKQGLLAQVDDFKKNAVSEDELVRGKAMAINQLFRALQENDSQVLYMAFFESAGLGYDGLDKLAASIRSVTAADVKRVAEKYLKNPVVSITKP